MFSLDDLSALKLEGVAISAEVHADEDTLKPVSGMWQKLGEETLELARRGLLRLVVVAAEQDDVPEEYLHADATPLRVIKARTITEAIRYLTALSRPRLAVRAYEREHCQYLAILDTQVPIEQHYQELPLLREVKQKDLPHDQRSTKEEKEEEPALNHHDILRWEEEQLRDERVTYQSVELCEVLQNFQAVLKDNKYDIPRFVVIGPPGSGKSTLIQYLVWQVANDKWQVANRQLIPVRVRLQDWEAWATKTADPEHSLPEYLADQYKDLTHAPDAALWRRWLYKGEVLLLLDGLDEMAGKRAFRQTLINALTAFSGCPTVLTCRTVSFEQHKALCPDFPVFTLAGLPIEKRDAYIKAYPAQHPGRFDAEQLIRHFNQTFQLQPLGTNPLLLGIICFVVDSPNGLTLPATRGELYNRAVEKLLTQHKRVTVNYPGEEPDNDEKRIVLERVALGLFAQADRKLTFTERELSLELKSALKEEDYQDAAPWANALRADFTQNSGLLRGDSNHGYFFLHLTVQELLTAFFLARAVNTNEKKWEAIVNVSDKRWTVRELIDKKAWDPRWQEVIVLFASQLDDPLPLLRLLADKGRDDFFRHRLALAALCLPELSLKNTSDGVPLKGEETVNAAADAITTQAFSEWWEHYTNGTAETVPHLTQALPALGQVNAQINGTSLLAHLEGLLADTDETVVEASAEAVCKLRGIAITPGILTRLVNMADPDGGIIERLFLRTVERLGPVAPTSEVLTYLSDLLADPSENVRRAAFIILRKLGNAAATPEILSGLADLLTEPPWEWYLEDVVCNIGNAATTPEFLSRLAEANVPTWRIVEIVDRLGSAAATPEILTRLVHLLEELDEDQAPDPFKRLGGSAATAEVLTRLSTLLAHHSWDLRRNAVEAVGDIGSAAGTPEILARLATLLTDPAGKVRRAAVDAVGKLGSAAATPEIFTQLAKVLADPEGDVRRAVGRLRDIIGRSGNLTQLAQLLADVDWEVYRAAIDTVCELGSAAATPEVLTQLAKRLADPAPRAWYIRRAAAEAVGRLGSVAATPEILAQLAALLADPDEYGHAVREAAAEDWDALGAAVAFYPPQDPDECGPLVPETATWAVGRLGSAAATPEILTQLAVLLADPYIRRAAVEAVGKLGSAAATPAFLTELAQLLADVDREVHRAAIDTVCELGSLAATPEILTQLAELLADPVSYRREAAVEAVSGLGSAAATPEILTHLTTMLTPFARKLRGSDALKAIGRIGITAVTPKILAGLAACLADPERSVRQAAVETAGQLGPTVATPKILAGLAACLADPERSVRQAAVETAGQLGPTVAAPEFLARLTNLLADPEESVRQAAVETVGQLGPTVATPKILAGLAACLADPERSVRQAAVETAGQLGPTVAAPEFLARLTNLLADPDKDLRELAVKVIVRLSEQRVRVFKLPQRPWPLRKRSWKSRTVEELSH